MRRAAGQKILGERSLFFEAGVLAGMGGCLGKGLAAVLLLRGGPIAGNNTEEGESSLQERGGLILEGSFP